MPRPSNPQVRERLIARGRQVVHEQGFHGCGVQDITAAASVPKGSFYNYFNSKEDFSADVLESYWQMIEDKHGPILREPGMKPLTRLRKFFHQLSLDHKQDGYTLGCLIGNLSLELSGTNEPARRKIVALLHRWQKLLMTCLIQAQDGGELGKDADTGELAAILIESYEGAVMRSKIEQSGGPLERFEKFVLDRLLG